MVYIIKLLLFSGLISAQTLAVKVGHLFESQKGDWLKDQVLLLDRDKITEVNPRKVPEGIPVIDLSDFFVVPGLIDAHTHLFLEDPTLGIDFSQGLSQFHHTKSLLERIKIAKVRSSSLMDFGITSVRDLGNDGGATLLNWQGEVRLFSSGGGHTPIRGQFPISASQKSIEAEYNIFSDEAFKKISQHLFPVLKLYADEEPNIHITDKELLKKWVTEGRKLGFNVSVHAMLPQSIENAIYAHPHTIEHGDEINEVQLKKIKDQNIIWVPSTANTVLLHPKRKNLKKVPGDIKPGLDKTCKNVKLAHKLGVKMAFGSDNYFSLEKEGISFGEGTIDSLLYFKNCGLLPKDILQLATSWAAEALGQKELGSFYPGSYADFVVYRQDPLKDLQQLKSPVQVYKGGRKVR